MEDQKTQSASVDSVSEPNSAEKQKATERKAGFGGNMRQQKQQQRLKQLQRELAEAKKAAPTIIVGEVAAPARMKVRHYGVMLSFLFFVALPSAAVMWYLQERAADQYASFVGFSVHTEDTTAVTDVLGGAIDLGGGGSKDSDILYEYIQSQELVAQVDKALDLRKLFSKPENDPIFTFEKDGTVEDLRDYWLRMVQIYYDTSTQLIELRVQAFSAEDAYLIAQEIFTQSSDMINRLSAIARKDTIGYAAEELEKAQAQLKKARQALTEFRNRTKIVDPTADVQGQMGLLNTLQTQLAQALIEQDLLAATARANDPRLEQAARKIEVIRKRISAERETFGISGDGGNSEEFNALLSQFEALTVEREFAEKAWLAARSAYDGAIIEANRKSRYLAAYVGPTRAERAEYPERITFWVLTTVLLFLFWAIMTLVFYSARDRR